MNVGLFFVLFLSRSHMENELKDETDGTDHNGQVHKFRRIVSIEIVVTSAAVIEPQKQIGESVDEQVGRNSKRISKQNAKRKESFNNQLIKQG